MDLEGNFASGRAEDSILFHTNFCTMCKNLCGKDKQVPRCRRRVGLFS